MKGYSVERVIEIWNDDIGDRIEVGPDRDGLDMIEIRQVDRSGEIVARLVLSQMEAELVANALIEATRKGAGALLDPCETSA